MRPWLTSTSLSVLHARNRGDSSASRGTCFWGAPRLRFKIGIPRKRTVLEVLMRAYGMWVLNGFILLTLGQTARKVLAHVKHSWQDAAKRAKIVEEAMSSVRNLAYPMVLMPAEAFKPRSRSCASTRGCGPSMCPSAAAS